jgi:hypothetical protein
VADIGAVQIISKIWPNVEKKSSAESVSAAAKGDWSKSFAPGGILKQSSRLIRTTFEALVRNE